MGVQGLPELAVCGPRRLLELRGQGFEEFRVQGVQGLKRSGFKGLRVLRGQGVRVEARGF